VIRSCPTRCRSRRWRRLVASLINLVAAIAAVATAGFAGYKLRRWLAAPLRPLKRRFDAWSDARDDASGPPQLSLRTRMLLEIVPLTLELGSVNRRSLGARVMRIRRADVQTGGPVSPRRALTRHLAQRASGAVSGKLASRAMKRSTAAAVV